MKIGLFHFNTDDGADSIALAREAEQLGFESIFFGDHSHIPASRRSPYPDPPFGELPRHYYRMQDPFISLAAIASVTERIRLGTSICLVVERDPITLAKVVATLDHISNGRVILGVGAGWNLEEMENHGTDPETRIALLRERVEAMREIWTREQAEYHGRFVNFDPIFAWPKPKQTPHPPILVGGMGPTVHKRVVAYGDGWLPGHMKDLGALQARIDELQQHASEKGRSALPITIISPDPRHIPSYVGMGIERAILGLPAGPAEETFQAMRAIAAQVTDHLDT